MVVSHLLTGVHRVLCLGGHLLLDLWPFPGVYTSTIVGSFRTAHRRVNIGIHFLVVRPLIDIVGKLRTGHLLIGLIVLLRLVIAVIVAVKHVHCVVIQLLAVMGVLTGLLFSQAPAQTISYLRTVRTMTQRSKLVLLSLMVLLMLQLLLILHLHLVVRGRDQLDLNAVKRYAASAVLPCR